MLDCYSLLSFNYKIKKKKNISLENTVIVYKYSWSTNWIWMQITWFTISKKSPTVFPGFIPQNFHWHVPPIPTSVSETLLLLLCKETQDPMAPDTLSSLEV